MAYTAASGKLPAWQAMGSHLKFTKTIAVTEALLQFAEHDLSQSRTISFAVLSSVLVRMQHGRSFLLVLQLVSSN